MRVRTRSIWKLVPFLGVPAIGYSCQRPEAAPPPPAPCFDSQPTLAQLQGLEYDPVLGAADAANVDYVHHTLGTGTASWIEPETNAYSPSVRGRLASGQTCVLARVRTATKVTVSPFMGDSVAYWLVTGIPDSVGQSWFVPNNGQPASAYMKAWLKGHAGVHGHSPWGHAIARFLRGSVFAWGVCGDMCCSGALE